MIEPKEQRIPARRPRLPQRWPLGDVFTRQILRVPQLVEMGRLACSVEAPCRATYERGWFSFNEASWPVAYESETFAGARHPNSPIGWGKPVPPEVTAAGETLRTLYSSFIDRLRSGALRATGLNEGGLSVSLPPAIWFDPGIRINVQHSTILQRKKTRTPPPVFRPFYRGVMIEEVDNVVDDLAPSPRQPLRLGRPQKYPWEEVAASARAKRSPDWKRPKTNAGLIQEIEKAFYDAKKESPSNTAIRNRIKHYPREFD